MDEKIEVVTTKIEFTPTWGDKIITTVICGLAGMVVNSFLEKGYYSLKASRRLSSTKSTQES